MKQILIAFFAMFALQSSASVMVYDEVDMPFANYAGYLKESFDINQQKTSRNPIRDVKKPLIA